MVASATEHATIARRVKNLSPLVISHQVLLDVDRIPTIEMIVVMIDVITMIAATVDTSVIVVSV